MTPDGVTLAYRLWRPAGPRHVLVLVHGLASNLTRWTEFVSTTRLRETWDLLRVDLRGFAGSACRRRVGLNEWSRDVATILSAEGAPPAVVVGHCLGANVALRFAERYPTATRGLVPIEPMFPEALTAMRSTMRLAPIARALVPVVRTLNALGVYRRRLAPLDLEELDRRAREAMSANPDAFPEDLYGSPVEDLKSTATAVYLQGLLAMTEAPARDLRAIAQPVLALLSTGARYGDPSLTRDILERLPHGAACMLPARHWIPTERPAEMREAIEAWCDAVARPGSGTIRP